MSSFGSDYRPERELDGDELFELFAVPVLDGVDDGLADGDANPVDRVVVQPGEVGHAVAHHLDEVQGVEVTVNLKPDRTSARQHAVTAARVPGVPNAAWTMKSATPTDCWKRTRMPLF